MNLAQLIESRRGNEPLRLSLRDLSRRSGLSKATWQTHATPRPTSGRRMPTRRTIHLIARGLDVDAETVWRAIGESMRVLDPDPARPDLLDALPPREVLARLDPEQIAAVVQFIHLLADTDAPAAAQPGSPARVHAQSATSGSTRASLATAGA